MLQMCMQPITMHRVTVTRFLHPYLWPDILVAVMLGKEI